MSGPRIVALGGGHGLAASLSALKLVSDDVTAIVTVADNGGSSGRLRDEFDVLPPGDLRMALSALCDDSEWGHTWRDVLQHRFPGDGPLGGHALGNLLIVSLWDLHEDPVAGLDLVGRLLNSRGRVLPMAAVPLEIEAEVRGLDLADPEAVTPVRGQFAVATTSGRVQSISLLPADPPACPESVRSVREADWVVLGPGSWFTSVMPHLMVPGLRDALHEAGGRRLLTLNLEPAGETEGFSAENHLESLARHAPSLRLDAVLADPGVVEDRVALERAAGRLGAELAVAPVAKRGAPGRHDSLRLAAAYRDILG
jgi:uncharacterized cofD-like protein